MSQNSKDWRGNSKRFLTLSERERVEYATQEVVKAWKDGSPTKLCEIASRNGSVICRFLTSALSHWRTYIVDLTSNANGGKPGRVSSESFGGVATQVAVFRGLALGITLTATCRECKRRNELSTTLPLEWLEGWSWRSLVPSRQDATFISWELAIGNNFKAGLWGLSL